MEKYDLSYAERFIFRYLANTCSAQNMYYQKNMPLPIERRAGILA